MHDQRLIEPKIASTRNAAISFIYVTIILDVLALGIIIPVFPRLVVGFSANTVQGAEIYGLFITLWGLANNEIRCAAAILVFPPIGLAGPALQSLMSRRVKPSEQGQLQGANSSITGLTSVLGPIIFTIVFSLSIGPLASFNLPGFPFILAPFSYWHL